MKNTNMNLKEADNDAQTYSNIEAQMLANIADEIYEEIKDLMENAESVSIKVADEKPISFRTRELFEISRLSDDELAEIAKSK